MQTKSVLTALSLTILCSTTAFGMMPRLAAAAMRRTVQQAGRTTFRPDMRSLPRLPRNGAPRRFLSDSAATPSPAKQRAKWSVGKKALLGVGVGIGTFSMAFGPAIWRHHYEELEKKRDKKTAEEEEKERTQEVVEIVMRKQLSQKTIEKIENEVAATQNPFWPAYKQERYRLLHKAYIEQFKKAENEPEARHAQFHGFASRKTT